MAQQKKQNKQPKLSIKEIKSTLKRKRILATYSIGTLGGSGFGAFTKSMRNIYFVQTMGLTNAQYASATVIGNIVNGVANPVIGFLMDKRIFRRKYSPWILIGGIGVVTAYLILYFIPWTPIVNSTSIAWFTAMLMVVLVGFFHAMSKINNSSIFAALTLDGRERILAKMFSGWIGGAGKTIGKVTWPFLFYYFQNTLGEEKSYLPTVFCLGILLIIFMLIKWREIRKFIPGDIEGAKICEETGKLLVEDRLPVKDMIKNLLKNYPLFVLILIGISNMTKRTFASTTSTMYFNYVIGDIRWKAYATVFIAPFTPFLKVGVPVFALAVGDPKTLALIAKFGHSIMRVIIFLYAKKNIWVFLVVGIVRGALNRLDRIANGVITAGAVDYGEWKNGVRHPGLIYAVKGIGANAGQAIGIILRSFFLEKIGFKKGFIPDEEFKSKFMYAFLVSGAFSFINGLLLLLFYPMSQKKLDELKVILEERRAQKKLEEAQKRREERAQKKEQ